MAEDPIGWNTPPISNICDQSHKVLSLTIVRQSSDSSYRDADCVRVLKTKVSNTNVIRLLSFVSNKHYLAVGLDHPMSKWSG